MAFLVPTTLTDVKEVKQVFDHGFTEEEEIKIKAAKAEIDKRDLLAIPVTLEEFRTTIAPWFRINRTEEFILHPEKEKKVRIPKEPKAPKVKKLTKKQVQEKLQALIMKMALGESFTEEEDLFFKQQTGQIV